MNFTVCRHHSKWSSFNPNSSQKLGLSSHPDQEELVDVPLAWMQFFLLQAVVGAAFFGVLTFLGRPSLKFQQVNKLYSI